MSTAPEIPSEPTPEAEPGVAERPTEPPVGAPSDRSLSTPVLGASLFLLSGSLVVFELLLTRLFSLIMFAHLANMAIALALLGIGIGATALHLFPNLVPRERLAERVGYLALLTGLAAVLGTFLALNFPLNEQWDYSTTTIKAWNSRAPALINKGTLAALMPFLMLPFCFGGLAFSAIFKHARDRIGKLYAADLWGGALGSALFIPVLEVLSGPDTVFVPLLGCGITAFLALKAAGNRTMRMVAAVITLAAVGLVGVAATGSEILKVKYTAGYAEKDIRYTLWTPEARLSIHDDRARRRTAMVLDTSSASEIVTDERMLASFTRSPGRALALRLHKRGGRVAVIAASAGNEVATAQYLGYRDVTAIDIAGKIFKIVKERFKNVRVNPYLQPGIRLLDMDGRAGIVHSHRKFDLIIMRWANLNNAAGILSNAWSPSLLETREAFVDYLHHLRPGGYVAFAKGPQSRSMVPSALAALREVGIRHPSRAIALVENGNESVFLMRRTPFPREETRELLKLAKQMGGRVTIRPDRRRHRRPNEPRVLTDDRPYRDSLKDLKGGFLQIFKSATAPDAGMYRINMVLWIQALVLILAGALFVGLPLLLRGRRDLANLHGKGKALAYASAIGYAYLAIETVLIHDLVLFVGHPTYAITLVVLVMLLGSGIGSARAGGFPLEGLSRRLRVILLIVIAFALIQALVLPAVYARILVGSAIWLRVAIVGISLFPLAYFMGMPFPLAMRLLPGAAGEIVPWCWALNGWMSVVAAMLTVFLTRQLGYTVAFIVAVAFYGLAMLLAGGLERVGQAMSAARSND